VLQISNADFVITHAINSAWAKEFIAGSDEELLAMAKGLTEAR